MVYEWNERGVKDGANAIADAQKVGEAIERLASRNPDHVVKPEQIVGAAHNSRSVMHGLFEWDDKAAAHEHRLQQARMVVRSLAVIEEREDGRKVDRPAFYHVDYRANGTPEESRRVTGYQPIEVVVQESRAQQSAAEYLLSQLDGLQRRYAALGDLFEPVWAEVSRIRERVEAEAEAA